MSFFKNLANAAAAHMNEMKEQAARERAFVENNIGSRAIASYIAALFEKGNSGYTWLKEYKQPLNVLVEDDSVTLFYDEYTKNPQSFKDAMPKKRSVGSYGFQEIYRSRGVDANVGFARLDTKTEKNELLRIINGEIENLSHMKYNGGWLVKMFQ